MPSFSARYVESILYTRVGRLASLGDMRNVLEAIEKKSIEARSYQATPEAAVAIEAYLFEAILATFTSVFQRRDCQIDYVHVTKAFSSLTKQSARRTELEGFAAQCERIVLQRLSLNYVTGLLPRALPLPYLVDSLIESFVELSEVAFADVDNRAGLVGIIPTFLAAAKSDRYSSVSDLDVYTQLITMVARSQTFCTTRVDEQQVHLQFDVPVIAYAGLDFEGVFRHLRDVVRAVEQSPQVLEAKLAQEPDSMQATKQHGVTWLCLIFKRYLAVYVQAIVASIDPSKCTPLSSSVSPLSSAQLSAVV